MNDTLTNTTKSNTLKQLDNTSVRKLEYVQFSLEPPLKLLYMLKAMSPTGA